jgi:hypothetical protein
MAPVDREGLASRACINVSALPLDKAVTDRMITVITPRTIELAFAALTNLEERDREISAQWRMRIERARYEVDLAERRYEAVDPANRLIAATLERRWNKATQRLHDVEAELSAFEQKCSATMRWPRRMSAAMAAGYCGEDSIDAFRMRVGVEYPQPRVKDGQRQLWLRDDLDQAILSPELAVRDLIEDL